MSTFQEMAAAIKAGDIAKAQEMLAGDAGLAKESGDGGRTALHMACAGQSKRPLVEALIDAGADINAKDDKGYTPLHVTTVEGMAGIIPLLLDRGAEVNARTNDGKTALALSFDEGAVDVSDILEQRGGIE